MKKITKIDKKSSKAITLIALVITIIILLILAGVIVNTLGGENGLFTRAKQARAESVRAEAQENFRLILTQDVMDNIELSRTNAEKIGLFQTDGYDITLREGEYILDYKGYEFIVEFRDGDVWVVWTGTTIGGGNNNEGDPVDPEEPEDPETPQELQLAEFIADGSWDSAQYVNTPQLMTGMRGIYWDSTGTKQYVTAQNHENWYNYTTHDITTSYSPSTTVPARSWANAETADGSMWVWIPRFAYKIESDKTINVNYIQTTTTSMSTEGYKIHPAFENGSTTGKNNNYMNGEWDEDLAGFWVAKFPAGYAGGNNNVTPVDSGETYSGIYGDGTSNFYGSITSSNSATQQNPATTMKYPVFIGQAYAYNFINIGDSYKLTLNLTKSENPYGLSSAQTNSHQMKNSEWGAVAYLTHSQYGLNGVNALYINNVNLNSVVKENGTNRDLRIYAVTGYAGEGTDTLFNGFDSKPTLGDNITGKLCSTDGTGTDTTSYAWYTLNGQKGSSTQNITGVYDLSGCVCERVSAYTSNGTPNLSNYGATFASVTANKTGYQILSTRLATVYPYGSSDSSNYTSDSAANNWNRYNELQTSTYGYGDAILETSTSSSGLGKNSWNGDYSRFMFGTMPFITRGGYYEDNATSGEFNFIYANGVALNLIGFRAVLVAE